MEYFKTKAVRPPQQPLSEKKAQAIFELLKAGWDETTIFEDFGHLTYHIEQVKKEFLDVKKEIYNKVTVEKAPTKTALRDSLSVDKLDANDCLNTVVAKDGGDPDSPLTYTQFVARYKVAPKEVVVEPEIEI